MKAKLLLSALVVGMVVGALLAGPAGSAAAKSAAKPTTVGEDPAGDWGEGVEPALAPLGDFLGQDLVSAAISQDGKNINFIIGVNSLPPWGGMPEVSRYTWDFNVGKAFTELDGKFTNYSRGVCDPTSGQCPPPRDPGMQPFFVRGNCTVNEANVTTCEEIGLVEAEFDPAKGTITIPVPMNLIKAKPGTVISPAANIFGGAISAAPSAFFTSSAMPLDTLTVTKSFKVK